MSHFVFCLCWIIESWSSIAAFVFFWIIHFTFEISESYVDHYILSRGHHHSSSFWKLSLKLKIGRGQLYLSFVEIWNFEFCHMQSLKTKGGPCHVPLQIILLLHYCLGSNFSSKDLGLISWARGSLVLFIFIHLWLMTVYLRDIYLFMMQLNCAKIIIEDILRNG